MSAFSRIAAAALAATIVTGVANAEESALPDTVIWTTYGTGSTTYNQAIAIGSVLKTKAGVNLRLLPGKNDISRLAPVRAGKAQFSSTGSDSIYAQEAIYAFGEREWGPQPVRILLQNLGNGCIPTFSIAGDVDVSSVADLKGKRIGFVKSSPGLQKSGEALLAYAGLTYDDVEPVEVSGYGAAIDAVIAGSIDAQITASTSSSNTKIQAGPRGLKHVPVPADNPEGWARLKAVIPWYEPTVCTDGPGIPKTGMEGVITPFPILVSIGGPDEATAYAMTKAMYAYYDDYKDAAPDNQGWAMAKQNLEGSFLPFHDGAIRYYKEIGAWTEAAEANQQKMLTRQKLLQDSWTAYLTDAPADPEAFKAGWAAARAKALEAAELPVIATSW